MRSESSFMEISKLASDGISINCARKNVSAVHAATETLIWSDKLHFLSTAIDLNILTGDIGRFVPGEEADQVCVFGMRARSAQEG